MKKINLRFASVLLSLGAMSLASCGDGPEIKDNLVEVTCASCKKVVKVSQDATTCPECNGPLKSKCPPHDFGEFVVQQEATAAKDGVKVSKCSKCGATKEQAIPALGFDYNLTIKDASGAVIKNETVKSINKIEKPTDPNAPEGQVFYGWKNVKNGGQIWNFDDDVLGLPKADVELVPCYVPANIEPQYIEAEFAPAITANGGMEGATYSGGAKGKGMIQTDANYECGSGCEIAPFEYYDDPSTFLPTLVPANGTIPAGAEKKTADPKSASKGYFFHFNYVNGNELVFNIVSDKDVSDAVIFGRFSGEYGIESESTGDRTSSFNQDSFPITVNGTKLNYGTITFHNIPAVGHFLPFQDFYLSASVSLKAGNNVISMKVNNTDSVNGTLKATSPCIDSLKVYTSATLTWPEAALTNIIGD